MITSRRGRDVAVAPHGGRFGEDREIYHDFSVCLNAYGPAPAVVDAIRRAEVDDYPDPTSRVARATAAQAWSVSNDALILGAGSAELIDLVCRAFVGPDDVVAIDAPAFGEYERAARIYGARVAREIDDAARVVFVCSPSNPLGTVRDRTDLRALADRCAARGALLVIDQAYDDFTDEPAGTPLLRHHPAAFHLRSLTKGNALAGVRVAFGIGTREIVDALDAVRVPWSASSAAQQAAIAVFRPDAKAHVERTTALLRREAVRLRSALAALGYQTNDSRTHFFTVAVRNGERARLELIERFHILVRDCRSFGMPHRIRVAARQPAANDELLRALAELSPLLL